MATKKRKTETESVKPDREGGRVVVLSLKGSEEYRAYLANLSKESRSPVSWIVRDAIAAWAKAKGLPAPPEA